MFIEPVGKLQITSWFGDGVGVEKLSHPKFASYCGEVCNTSYANSSKMANLHMSYQCLISIFINLLQINGVIATLERFSSFATL